METRERFVRALVFLAKECGKELLEPHFALYCRAFASAGLERGVSAIEHILLNRRERDPFPSPKELLSIAMRSEEDPGSAEDIASRMIGAVAKFGHTNPEAAKEFIGSIGWSIIELEGGWSRLCLSMKESNITIYKAQWKKSLEQKINEKAESIIRRALSPARVDAPREIE